MALNKIAICNIALARLSEDQIQSLDEANSTEARYCKLFYDHSRQYLLRLRNFGFSKAVVSLALTTEEPLGWTYSYQKPSDCLKIRRLSPEAGAGTIQSFVDGEMVYLPNPAEPVPVPYDLVGDRIWTDLSDAYAVYTKDVTDESKFDSLFTDLLGWRLAYDVAMPLTGKHVLRDKMLSEFNSALAAAASASGNERRTNPPTFSSDILRSRR